MFRYEWIWEKTISTGFLNANRMPLKIHENILIFYNELPVYNPKMGEGKPFKKGYSDNDRCVLYGSHRGDYIKINEGTRYPNSIIKFKRDTGLHPTQKPVALFEYLIKTYTNENELVLDNCAGSGTTGVACENLNRNSILMEQEPEYCQIIKDRMATAHELKLEQRKQTSLQAFKGQQTLITPAK